MSLAITPDTKNALSLTNETKPATGTFGTGDPRPFSSGGTFGTPGTSLTVDSKNTLTVTSETKS